MKKKMKTSSTIYYFINKLIFTAQQVWCLAAELAEKLKNLQQKQGDIIGCKGKKGHFFMQLTIAVQ